MNTDNNHPGLNPAHQVESERPFANPRIRIAAAVGCSVLLGIGLLGPTIAGPLARFGTILLIGALTFALVWPLVTRFPEGNPAAAMRHHVTIDAPMPTELERLTAESRFVAGGGNLGHDTLVHLRYVARFRLVVGHKINPDAPADLDRMRAVAGPQLAAIAGVWPPDHWGKATEPIVPASDLPLLIERLEAL